MTERENLLQRVRMYQLALIEATMFLDGHPKNAAALAYHKKNQALYDEAVAAFQAKFGPLTPHVHEGDTEWQWISDPWPWEGADN